MSWVAERREHALLEDLELAVGEITTGACSPQVTQRMLRGRPVPAVAIVAVASTPCGATEQEHVVHVLTAAAGSDGAWRPARKAPSVTVPRPAACAPSPSVSEIPIHAHSAFSA